MQGAAAAASHGARPGAINMGYCPKAHLDSATETLRSRDEEAARAGRLCTGRLKMVPVANGIPEVSMVKSQYTTILPFHLEFPGQGRHAPVQKVWRLLL